MAENEMILFSEQDVEQLKLLSERELQSTIEQMVMLKVKYILLRNTSPSFHAQIKYQFLMQKIVWHLNRRYIFQKFQE